MLKKLEDMKSEKEKTEKQRVDKSLSISRFSKLWFWEDMYFNLKRMIQNVRTVCTINIHYSKEVER
jgi:hypothetical protein